MVRLILHAKRVLFVDSVRPRHPIAAVGHEERPFDPFVDPTVYTASTPKEL